MYISVVIPIFNEEENLPLLTEKLVQVLTSFPKYEIIYIDDGSSDSSVSLIENYCRENSSIKLIRFTRNFGHQQAITAGINFASGDAVIAMDGDLQDPPEVIPDLVTKCKEGFDVVYAVRRKRKENIFKRFAYFAFYRLMRYISAIDIPLDTGDFSLMSRKVVDSMKMLPEKERFVRGIRTWVGYKQTGLEYERASRYSGEAKYTFTKLLKLAYDGLTSFSHKPLKLSAIAGVFFTFLSFVAIAYIVHWKLTDTTGSVPGWASTIASVFLIGGIQLLIISIQGEYLSRIFDEAKGRPTFLVASTLNIEKNDKD